MVGKFESELEVATHVTEALEKEFGNSWHCIVGYFFASSIVMGASDHVNMKKGSLQILVFRE